MNPIEGSLAAPSERWTQARMAINAPHPAAVFEAAVSPEARARARLAGFETEIPGPPEPPLAARPPWSEIADRLARESASEPPSLTGFIAILTMVERRVPLAGRPPFVELLPVELEIQRQREPHRAPLIFGSTPTRSESDLREETLAYWQAADIRAALPALGFKPPSRSSPRELSHPWTPCPQSLPPPPMIGSPSRA